MVTIIRGWKPFKNGEKKGTMSWQKRDGSSLWVMQNNEGAWCVKVDAGLGILNKLAEFDTKAEAVEWAEMFMRRDSFK